MLQATWDIRGRLTRRLQRAVAALHVRSGVWTHPSLARHIASDHQRDPLSKLSKMIGTPSAIPSFIVWTNREWCGVLDHDSRTPFEKRIGRLAFLDLAGTQDKNMSEPAPATFHSFGMASHRANGGKVHKAPLRSGSWKKRSARWLFRAKSTSRGRSQTTSVGARRRGGMTCVG